MGSPSTAAWNARATQGRSGQRRDAAPSYLLLTEGQQHDPTGKSQTAEHERERNRPVLFLQETTISADGSLATGGLLYSWQCKVRRSLETELLVFRRTKKQSCRGDRQSIVSME